jgi:hypothetical protein
MFRNRSTTDSWSGFGRSITVKGRIARRRGGASWVNSLKVVSRFQARFASFKEGAQKMITLHAKCKNKHRVNPGGDESVS